jgi:GntR family transcriptional regulator, transcriptional repressor for pyruvate dehydrogenase complex
MFETKPVKRITVTEQVMEQIANYITSGNIKPGEKLPNERELAENFGVTRGRIREALRALSLVGLITIKAGEGSFVNEQEEPIPADTIVWLFHNERHNIEEVYAARKLIETEVYLTAFQNMNENEVNQLEEYVSFLKHVEEKGGSVEDFQAIIDEYDLFIGTKCGNNIYDKLMQTIVHLRRDTSYKILKVPGSMESSIISRERIMNSFKGKDIEKVKDAIGLSFTKAKLFYESIIHE